METNSLNEDLDCCIVGRGPAGMMLGFLLARAGIKVLVLEKHKDFFRDFRGDTIHPSTFQTMHELGLLDEFLKVPHQEMQKLQVVFNGREVKLVDFTHLPVARPALGLMPQWDFLNFVLKQASTYPTFKLNTEARVTNLVREGNRVTGVINQTPAGEVQIKAKLVIGADGRSSVVRVQAGLKVIDTGAPIDVLWFRLSHQLQDPEQTLGRFLDGKIMVLLNRGDYWQCAYVIEKDGFKTVQQNGLESFKKDIAAVSPFLSNRVEELKNWDDIKLLSVEIDHLEQWYTEGLLCIGDAAHAMSPIGGVGINLAIQDAVAAANILYPHLKNGTISTKVLKQVQQRREWPVRLIQRVQVVLQKGVNSRQKNPGNKSLPLFLRVLNTFPVLRRIPARLVGLGIRPEHVNTPDIKAR